MSRRARCQDTVADVAADVLTEFLEAALYSTLQRRGVYGAEHFTLRPLYGVHVAWARAPALLEYINDFLVALRPYIRTGKVKCVVLVVTSAARVALERHVFELGLAGDAADAADVLAKGGGNNPPAATAEHFDALEQLKRLLGEALTALGSADAWLPERLPPGAPQRRLRAAPWRAAHPPAVVADCTFQLLVHSSARDADPAVFWVTKDVLPAGSAGLAAPLTASVHSVGARQQAPLLRVQILAQRTEAEPLESPAPLSAAPQRSSQSLAQEAFASPQPETGRGADGAEMDQS
jgi:hypothetical protein